MLFKKAILFLVISLLNLSAKSQLCTDIGKTPSTAFNICGADTFNQETLLQCSNAPILANRCGAYNISNAFWNKFDCFQTGSLGFSITPKYKVSNENLGDDYNWELFDITAHNPDDVYTDPSLFVCGNWSGTYGVTGTSGSASDTIVCISNNNDRISPYSIMPIIHKGHTYLLMVTHYIQIASFYQLSFQGGTASITPAVHAFQNAQGQCNHTEILIKLSGSIKCSSLAPDGSDFTISSSSSQIISASGFGCTNNFSSDAITLKLSNPLSPGVYTVTAKTGSDGNTLTLNDCNKGVIIGDSVTFSMLAVTTPATMDSLVTTCASDVWQIVFDKPIECSSVAPDGSDFMITGPQPVIVQSASMDCVTGASNIVSVKLNSPVAAAGVYQITLVNGSDGNTIIDACNQPIAVGSALTTKIKNCYISVPSGFTPNNDGINDYLYPLNAYDAANLHFRVYNRYGYLVFETKKVIKKWNGSVNGIQQATGTYIWILEYTDKDGKNIFLKGTTALIR